MRKAKVLLVDDEVSFANNMSRLLTKRGYESTPVTDGVAAIETLKKEPFDVIILDLRMPLMDGMQTLREIKKFAFSSEILILTGHGSVDTAMEAIRMGAYDFVTKPCEVSELVTKIEAAFERKLIKEQKASTTAQDS